MSLNHPHIQRYVRFTEFSTLHKANGQNKQVAYNVHEMIRFSLYDHVEQRLAYPETICRTIFR